MTESFRTKMGNSSGCRGRYFMELPWAFLIVERARDSFHRPWYLEMLGMLVLWRVSVHCEDMSGVCFERTSGPSAEQQTSAVIEGGKELECEDTQLTTTNYGFIASYQGAICATVCLCSPLESSSGPLLHRMLPREKGARYNHNESTTSYSTPPRSGPYITAFRPRGDSGS